MLFPFKKIRVKPGTVLSETVLSGDPLYLERRKLSQKGTQPIYVLSYLACWHGGMAWRGVACLRLLERGEHTTKDCITKDLSTFVDYLAHLSRNNCLRSNLFHEVVTPSSSLESRNINALGSS